ncbi:cupin domain-containing protein [Gorillibacterium massiliense]|uniref:cupin domain-containing protein n=1 Tax=Gorillibacterium massiliense TaxID=1280390 RepID=UPI0004AD533D|nr:cupin domain-containing protein [Gorillibacterium massiliense]
MQRTSYVEFDTANAQFTFDLANDLYFRKDADNYINRLSIKDLNTLGNVSLLDIYLSKSNVVEPHIHPNAAELVYCIAGESVVSLINPFSNQLLNFTIKPGQVANVPQAWWHYEIASVDDTHLLAIFDAPVPEAIFGSDILRLTPPNVWAHTYCLDEAAVKSTLAPITGTTIIGPPVECGREGNASPQVSAANYGSSSYEAPFAPTAGPRVPFYPYAENSYPRYMPNAAPPVWPAVPYRYSY